MSDPRWVLDKWAPGIRFQLSREFSRILRLTATQDNVFIHQSVRFAFRSLRRRWSTRCSRTFPRNTRRTCSTCRSIRDLRDDPLVTHRGSVQSVSGEAAGVLLRRSSSYVKGQFVERVVHSGAPTLAARRRSCGRA